MVLVSVSLGSCVEIRMMTLGGWSLWGLLGIVGWGLMIDGLSALFKETPESFLPFPSNRDCMKA